GKIEEEVENGEVVEKQKKKNEDDLNIQYYAGVENPFNADASDDMAMMVEYDKDTENLEEETSKVLEKIEAFNHEGTWSNLDVATGGASNEIKVTLTSNNSEALENAANDIEQALSDNDSLSNVSSD